MGDKHVVRFEPVGIEIEADEEQTILRAAAEQGVMLMHGCKEGQCASCKSFILDGDDVEHDSYSTIELLNYDEEMIHSGLPIVQAEAEVVSKEYVTHDMCHLVLRLVEPETIKF